MAVAPTIARKQPAERIERQLDAAERDQPGNGETPAGAEHAGHADHGGERPAGGGEAEEEDRHQGRWPISVEEAREDAPSAWAGTPG